MHPLIQMLASGQDKEPVLDVIPVPADKIETILQLIDDTSEPTEMAGKYLQLWRRWAKLHELIPALRGRKARLNDSNIIQPVFEVTGDCVKPVPNRLIKAVHDVPDDEIYNVIKRIDEANREQTMMSRYRQWSYIQGLFPELDLSIDTGCKFEVEAGAWICLVEFYRDQE